MNRRQKKKQWKKEESFLELFVTSYRELKKMNRSYHEYAVYCNRHNKKCISCVHGIVENGDYIACELIFRMEECQFEQKGEQSMASQNKKKKAKNSYLSNGGEKLDGRMKRVLYFTKRQRNKNKRIEQKGE